MLLLEQESFLKFVKIALSFGMEIVGLIFMFIEIKFPSLKQDVDRKLQNSFEFFLYSSNSEWADRMKYLWSIKNFKEAKGVYDKTVFIFWFITTWVVPISIIGLYFEKIHFVLFPSFNFRFIPIIIIILMANIVWFLYALFLVGPIRFVLGLIYKYFNGNVLGGIGFVFALVGILVKFFKLLFL
ncbi:MAG: hypothetical protein KAT05_12210 [Spirochaetes bacterium]|nr:hypothetical protein [Spirochaetota bacterium]